MKTAMEYATPKKAILRWTHFDTRRTDINYVNDLLTVVRAAFWQSFNVKHGPTIFASAGVNGLPFKSKYLTKKQEILIEQWLTSIVGWPKFLWNKSWEVGSLLQFLTTNQMLRRLYVFFYSSHILCSRNKVKGGLNSDDPMLAVYWPRKIFFHFTTWTESYRLILSQTKPIKSHISGHRWKAETVGNTRKIKAGHSCN